MSKDTSDSSDVVQCRRGGVNLGDALDDNNQTQPVPRFLFRATIYHDTLHSLSVFFIPLATMPSLCACFYCCCFFPPRCSARAPDSDSAGAGVSTAEGVSRGENGDAKPDVERGANAGDGEIPLPWRFLLC